MHSEQVSEVNFRNTTLKFHISNPRDHIQRRHQAGNLYEVEELLLIEKYFPSGGVFCDIGSNVGNHSVFVGKFLNPSKIVLFEPNPAACDILKRNIALNHLEAVSDLSCVEFGLSDEDSVGNAIDYPDNNLGAGRVVSKNDGAGIRLRPGDDILPKKVDFLKIDVEGMELNVLSGLQETLSNSRPDILIEVVIDTYHDVLDLLHSHGYRVLHSIRRYGVNLNLLARPQELVLYGAEACAKRATASDLNIRAQPKREKRTMFVFRTHKWTENEAKLFSIWKKAAPGPVCIAYDATNSAPPELPNEQVLSFDQTWIRENGLLEVRKVGWRFGDYALYRAMQAVPDVEYFLISDSDLLPNWPDLKDFFTELEACNQDLLTSVLVGAGPRRVASMQHELFDPFERKMSCRFGILRASRRLVEKAYDFRQLYSDAMRQKPVRPFANDEALFATLASNLEGYTAATFDEALPGGVTTSLLRDAANPVPIEGIEYLTFARTFAHPVATG